MRRENDRDELREPLATYKSSRWKDTAYIGLELQVQSLFHWQNSLRWHHRISDSYT